MTSCESSCITCGDVAIPLTVVKVDGDDATCVSDTGLTELVALELVHDVVAGDVLLVHAGVALEKLS